VEIFVFEEIQLRPKRNLKNEGGARTNLVFYGLLDDPYVRSGRSTPPNFHVRGAGHQANNSIVGVYIPTVRIPIKGGMTIEFRPWHILKTRNI